MFNRNLLGICVIFITGVCLAQTPATLPATQPGRSAGGGARGPATPPPKVVTPRDEQPFTASDFSKVNPTLSTLIIVGDSTADNGPDAWHRGWAATLMDYFDLTRINVVNRARGGRSFRSFLREGLWDQVLAAVQPGDWVMIQMGHNEGGDINTANGRPSLPGIGEETGEVKRADGTTEIVHTFGWYARKFVKDIRDKGANPVLMTSTTYNRWTNGTFNRAGSRVPESKQVAEQEKVLLLDHTSIISDRYQQLGQEAVGKLYSPDNLHTTTFGAIENAERFISGLKAMDIKPLVEALNDKGRAIETYKPAPKP